jgi:CPA1 family monovalent cation:H+ antiporter
VFTTVAVAAATHWLLGLPWPVGFVLGAIVSPPDAVAPLSILRRMQLPRRILVVLEGEGLANDATALILYRFAVAAVSAGVFSFGQAAGTFVAIVVGEILWGIGVGWLMLRLRRWVRRRFSPIGRPSISGAPVCSQPSLPGSTSAGTAFA